MKRPLAILVIVAYLSALSWGVVSHALTVGNAVHPVMYYLVWDMFCGWSGYETRQHLIAEGESGQYYNLTRAPWGNFRPFGPADRTDYDSFGTHSIAIAKNVLKNTQHEPMRRIYLVEENWSKRYNRPDYLWKKAFQEPKESYSYFHTRAIYDGEGQGLQMKSNWLTAIYDQEFNSDPRLARMRQQAIPFFEVTPASYSQRQYSAPIPGYASGIEPSASLTE